MNTGHDPMLSSICNENWVKLNSSEVASTSGMLMCTSNPFSLPIEGLLSPESSSSDFWLNDRKRAMSIKQEEEDDFASPDVSVSNEAQSVEDIDIEDAVKEEMTSPDHIKTEVHDPGYDDVHIPRTKREREKSTISSEADARRYVEEEFHKIAFIPNPSLSQVEKIEYILSKSDCKDYTTNDVLQFDKRCKDSARACAKIVQNIPQRYRWECVEPEDIPSCYTIVADCKKLSHRDKPPRPMNAFMIWAQGARRLINELCPKMQNAIISEALGDCWRNKSDAFKKNFEDEKNKLRRFHNVEFPEYKYKPKTKDQKAKEKEELSLSKAKMRASAKRTKPKASADTSTSKKKPSGKIGRPRKSPAPKVPDTQETPKQVISRSKPAIKDMLTLKILKDKNSKDHKHRGGTFHTEYGQLSPFELDSSMACDAFEDARLMDTGRDLETAEPPACKVTTPSVFDTPANTPPFNDNQETHPSPVSLTTPRSPPAVAPSTSTRNPALSQTSLNILVPTLTEMLSPSCKPAPESVFRLASSKVPVSIPVSVISLQPSLITSNRLPTQLYLVYGKDPTQISFKTMKSSAASSSQSIHRLEPVEDADCNNNQVTVTNNNGSETPSFLLEQEPDLTSSSQALMELCGMRETNDLDSLFDIDIQSPLLSDDQLNLLLSDGNF